MSQQSLIASAVASALAVSFGAAAQEKQDTKQEVKKVEQITVTASPLDRTETELAQPASVLNQEDLRRKRAASIGDTLSQETGVQSSAFGPGAGRPIIRGLDGPRVRVLENGIGTLDASNVSPDHMVTTESLHADQIEILRGPASLLYGSGAIGGIVNVVSNLIPRQPTDKLGGDFETRFSSGSHERTGAFNLNGGGGGLAWHLDAFKRKTDDYKIPGHAIRGDDESPAGTLPDTFVDAKGAGAGASWVGTRGYIGAGVEGLESSYGVPTGEGSHIHLKQTKYQIAGELADPVTGFARLRFRLGHNDYQHEEIESTGQVATTFKNKGDEARVELKHADILGLTGTIGVQLQNSDLSALGEEALFPKTKSESVGVFVVEQKDLGAWLLDGGLRFERAKRRPTVDPADVDKFGMAVSRDFALFTPALGAVWKFSPGYQLAISATQAQRAPATEELYSNGIHGATSTFELGNPVLRKEVSRNLDVTLRKVAGDSRWKVNLFANRIKDYVYAASVDADGNGIPDRVDDGGNLDPEGAFLVQHVSQADARFYGAEAEWSYRPEGGPSGVRVFGDIVRAKLADGSYIPRIAPGRIGVALDHGMASWTTHLTVIHSFAQTRVAPLETTTPGYTRVDAEVAYVIERRPEQTFTVFLQGTNLANQEIRLHTSYLKDVAPLMGRSFTLGLRAEF